MNIFRFLDWPVYKAAKQLNKKVAHICHELPLEAKIKYQKQLNSAALSVCLNIAEGAGRYSDLELCRHFDISLGSLSEVVAGADCLKDEGHISEDLFLELFHDAVPISSQLQGMKVDFFKNPRGFKAYLRAK